MTSTSGDFCKSGNDIAITILLLFLLPQLLCISVISRHLRKADALTQDDFIREIQEKTFVTDTAKPRVIEVVKCLWDYTTWFARHTDSALGGHSNYKCFRFKRLQLAPTVENGNGNSSAAFHTVMHVKRFMTSPKSMYYPKSASATQCVPTTTQKLDTGAEVSDELAQQVVRFCKLTPVVDIHAARALAHLISRDTPAVRPSAPSVSASRCDPSSATGAGADSNSRGDTDLRSSSVGANTAPQHSTSESCPPPVTGYLKSNDCRVLFSLPSLDDLEVEDFKEMMPDADSVNKKITKWIQV